MVAGLNDSYALASKLTLNRIKNAARVFTSYILSRQNGRPDIGGLPISLAIEPTTACNLRCPECPSGLRSFSRPTGKLNPTFFRQIIDELSSTLAYLTFYFQGEPYLNPAFLEMVEYASRKGIYTATSTNGHFLDRERARETVESGLGRLIISIDGITQETYAAYRQEGHLDKVFEATENVLYWRRKLDRRGPTVIWQFLVVKPNEHEIEGARRLAKKYGVDKLALKTAQIYEYENGNELIPTIDKYSRYRQASNGTFQIKNKLLDHCWKMWSSCVITWDGRVVPCCFDKDAHHSLGALSQNTFHEIWHSEAYRLFRQSVLRGRSEIEMCRNCTEGTKIWA
ncbi:MAG: SPASM domain-containing protein [Bacteroidota bacterium]